MTRHLTLLGPKKPIEAGADAALTIRFAGLDDRAAIAELAELDSSHTPRGTVLVAVLDDALLAAVSVDDLHGVADPFKPTSELLFLLLERARQVRRSRRPSTRRFLRPRPAARAA